MSRTSQLPPRFPRHPRVFSSTRTNASDLDLDLDLDSDQYGDVSDGPPPSDEQCRWVDDLVGGRDDGSKTILAPLRRCVSDPVPILEESFDFDFTSLSIDDDYYTDQLLKPLGTDGDGLSKSLFLDNVQVEGGSSFGRGPISLPTLQESEGSKLPLLPSIVPCPQMPDEGKGYLPPEEEEMRSRSVYGSNSPRSMERCLGSFYGPNSPRHMGDLTKSESSMVSAFLESAGGRNPFSNVVGSEDPPVGSCRAGESGAKVCAGIAASSESRDSDKTLRRHAGQRSRIRKVQYIGELERTVNYYQALVANLAARIGMVYQQRAVLSIENNTLRQEIANFRRNKMIKEGQHHFLKSELKKLKTASGIRRKNKSSCFAMDAF